MPEYVSLDFSQHRTLRVASGYGAHLGDDIGMVSVVPAEIPALVASYPLFFRRAPVDGSYELGAMLGFVADRNLFLRDGQWDAAYVPLSVRCQPFTVGTSTTAPDRNTLMIDIASPRLSREDGDMIFFSDGRPSERTQTAVDLLEALVRGGAVAREYVRTLDALGLIEPVELRIEQGDGQTTAIAGLHGIAAERLQNLSPAELGDLNARGYLAWVYLQAGSVGQVAQLMRRQSHDRGH